MASHPTQASGSRSLTATSVLAAALAITMQLIPSTAHATDPAPTGGVRGRVTALATGAPVPGATITLPGLDVRTTSIANGSFQFPQAFTTSYPYSRVEAVVTAPGFGRWTVSGMPLYPHDWLILSVQLRRVPFTHVVLTPQEQAAQAASAPRPEYSSYNYTCTGWTTSLVPPPSIRVWITEEKKSRRYGFLFYVQHVLPKEWLPFWDADALGAGAIAAKTYGAFRAMRNHAYSGGSGCADITDYTSDQVFDPTFSTEATDRAVDTTMGSILLRNDRVFLTNYWSGNTNDPCKAVTSGQFAGRMSQWGTENCAEGGMLWPDIVTTFYSGTTWRYLQNLLLNPGFENGHMYPWSSTDGSMIRRTNVGAYQGNWSLAMARTGSTAASLFQRRRFKGSASRDYHLSIALRCGAGNQTDCTVQLRIVAIAAGGARKGRSTWVAQPNDGKWRVFTFDRSGLGIDHDWVQVNVGSLQTIGIDYERLTTPFGGP
jgi:hypothetical protein